MLQWLSVSLNSVKVTLHWGKLHWYKQNCRTCSSSKQECIPVGCVMTADWPYLGVSRGGVSGQGWWCIWGGVSGWGGGGQTPLGGRPGGKSPSPVNRMTDACKNITFAALLRNAVGNKRRKTSYVAFVFVPFQTLQERRQLKLRADCCFLRSLWGSCSQLSLVSF